MNLILESERDRRVLEWLISQAGDAAVTAASERLVGSRKAYVSNIAKLLGLSPPTDLALTPKEDAKKHLKTIQKLLTSHEDKGGDDGTA